MPVTIKVLARERLTSSTSGKNLYAPPTASPAQAAIVSTMRFSNISAVTVTLNVYFVPSGSTYPTNARRILPKDLTLAAGATFVDDAELTLASGEAVYAAASAPSGTNWVDCVICGDERAV